MLFERWKYATVTILPAPTMCTVAAGLRSALVVDLGWEETVVTPVYEYRELGTCRTTRGMRTLILEMGEKLQPRTKEPAKSGAPLLRLDVDFLEDFISRVAFCETEEGDRIMNVANGMGAPSIVDTSNSLGGDISIEWPSQNASHTIRIPRSEISQVVQDCFFDPRREERHDDHEKTLDEILFRCLLDLQPDIRGICMSRVVFTGPGAAITGLKQQSLLKVQALVDKYGWTSVRGQHVKPKRRALAEIAQGRAVPVDARYDVALLAGKDYVEEKLQKQRSKEVHADSQGRLRCIESLGAWAGASLAASLKVKSVVEIERERFLSHGMSGASREADIGVVAQRMSGFGVGTKTSDRSSWTLGGWG